MELDFGGHSDSFAVSAQLDAFQRAVIILLLFFAVGVSLLKVPIDRVN